MQGRSWMAALTLTASALLGVVLGFGCGSPVTSRADDAKPTPPPSSSRSSEPAPAPAPAPAAVSTSRVKLDLAIAGLSARGCDVEIAPGSVSCRFRPVRLHLGHGDGGKALITFDDIQTTGADHYCIFAITIREPGQPVKIVRRVLRLVAPNSGQTQLLTCYLSSPSKLARSNETRERR